MIVIVAMLGETMPQYKPRTRVFRITPELSDELDQTAELEGANPAYLIREGIARVLHSRKYPDVPFRKADIDDSLPGHLPGHNHVRYMKNMLDARRRELAVAD